jgi:hypothetical protein
VDKGVVDFLVFKIGRGAVVAVGVMGGVGRPFGKVVANEGGVIMIVGDPGTMISVGILMQSGLLDGSDDMMNVAFVSCELV